MVLRNILLIASILSCSAYNLPTRRQVFEKAGTAATAAGVAFLQPKPAQAIQDCPKGSSNCIRTTWVAPEGTSKAEIAKTIKAVLLEYPQEGQSKVDLGGWKLVEDSLDKSGTARVEFQSGIGNWAKFLNGGKPFTDDVEIEIDGNKVEIRSSSRIGESDMGVNQKRLNFLANAVNAIGWDADKNPKY